MCKGEGDAFRASRDNVNTMTALVGEGRAKVVSAVPVRVPRKTVVGEPLRKDIVDRGGEVGGRRPDQAESEGSGRQGRMTLRVSSAWGRRRSQRSSGKSGWVEAKVEMRWFLLVLTDFSAGLDL